MTVFLVLAAVAVMLTAALVFVAFPSKRGRGIRAGQASIDPFTLQDPWRRHVQSALAAQAKVGRAVDMRADGPTRDRLLDMSHEINNVVARIWEVASEGHRLGSASRLTELSSLERRLTEAEQAAAAVPVDRSEASQASLSSVRSSVEAARRLALARNDSDAQLRQLGSRLDELVVRTIELTTVTVSSADSDSLRADLDSMIVDLEGLRQGLQETRAIADGSVGVE
jgi:hypothetical protein